MHPLARILVVSLLVATAVSLIFWLETGARSGWVDAVAVVLAGLAASAVYFGFRPFVRERRRIAQVVASSLGLRAGSSAFPPAVQWTEFLPNATYALVVLSLLLPSGILPTWVYLGQAAAFLGILAASVRNAHVARAVTESARLAWGSGDYVSVLASTRGSGPLLRSDTDEELSMIAMAHMRRREFAEAEALLTRGLLSQLDARRATALSVSLAGVYMEQGRFDNAARALDAATELSSPNDARVLEGKALLALRHGSDPAGALALAEAAASKGGTDRAAILRAWALAENGRVDEARREIEVRLRYTGHSKPDLAERSYHIGRALLRCGDRAAAEEQFRRAMAAEPGGLFGSLAEAAMRESR